MRNVDGFDGTIFVQFEKAAFGLWVYETCCVYAGTRTFSFDEPVNYDERNEWCRELMPIYHGVPRMLGCTCEILVSSFFEWSCLISLVDTAPVTVEADGDGSHRYFPLAAWDYHMMIYGRRDIVSERKAIYQLWHSGQLAHVSPCEVTL